jgi:hypothetical protein
VVEQSLYFCSGLSVIGLSAMAQSFSLINKTASAGLSAAKIISRTAKAEILVNKQVVSLSTKLPNNA